MKFIKESDEDEDTNLFVDRVAFSKYEVTTEQPREKGIMRSDLAVIQFPLDKQERLVDGDEFREIRRVLLRRARDGLQPREPTCVIRVADAKKNKNKK